MEVGAGSESCGGDDLPPLSPRARELKEYPDLLEEAVEAWHDTPEDGTPLHEFLGLSEGEYFLVVAPGGWLHHEHLYLDFMDYLVRNCVEE